MIISYLVETVKSNFKFYRQKRSKRILARKEHSNGIAKMSVSADNSAVFTVIDTKNRGKRILAYGKSVVAPSRLRKRYTSHCGCSSHEPLNTSAVLTVIDTKKGRPLPSFFVWWR